MNSKQILERAKQSLGLSSDAALADALGVRKSTLSNWKIRDSIDYDTLFSKCDKIDLNFLIRGKNPMEGLADRMSDIICAMSILPLDDIASYFDVSGFELGNFTNNIVLPKNAFNFTKFLSSWPEINNEWLIFGIGDMYNEGFSEESVRREIYETQRKHEIEIVQKELGILSETKTEQNHQTIAAHRVEGNALNAIPLIPYDAIAGYGSFDFQELPVEDYYTISELRGADFLIRVKGDSMSPKYNGGDIVACKRIDTITFWQWHKVYAICTRNQGILIKRVEEYQNNPAFITCRSENPQYRPFELHEDEIVSVALVMGAIVLE